MIKKITAVLASIILFGNTSYAQVALSADDNFIPLTLNPGDIYETTITIGNGYSHPVTLTLDAVDGTKSHTGYFAAKLPMNEQFFFGKWATIEKKVFNLDVGETVSTKVTYKIPDNATPGDYSGGITVTRERTGEKTVTQKAGQISAGIVSKSRLAKAVYISIPGERINDLAIGNLTYKKYPGRSYEMYIKMENKGNTTIEVEIEPSKKSYFGEVEKIDTQIIKLFPKEKVNLPINVGQMPILGVYDLRTNIKYFEFNLITNEKTPLGEVNKNIQLIIIPWNYIILILFIVLALITYFKVKKYRLKKIIKNSVNYMVQNTDTITTLAKQSNVNWKTLVKINKLNPPYEIKSGQTILLPNRKK